MNAGASVLSLPALFSYGLFGLPLAMLALPIYIYVAPFYAQRSSLDLAQIGAVLLAARIAAAFIDPALGAWMARGGRSYAMLVGAALPLLLLGFGALFHPPPMPQEVTLAWFLAALLLVYTAYGLAGIAHQSWGAALTQASTQRARVAAVREGCGLLGVILAAGLTSVLGYDGLSLAFAVCLLAAGALLLAHAPRPALRSAGETLPGNGWKLPFRQRAFRWLFSVLLVNGVAAAIPATLFLFFAGDYLRLGHYAGPFLIVYFCAAAASMPVWVALARRFGEARAWGGAMLLAATVFVWAYGLGAGAAWGFAAICLLSGLALGADLALPPALLAGLIGTAGHAGRHEAAYFGWWNWGVQMSLALAAGIALPLLAWLGYVPGNSSGGLPALAAAYALLPCALKLLAALLLWRAPLQHIYSEPGEYRPCT
ncbi:putative symporter YagG [Janthinobacterium sp. HH103]|uniref:MFS transporter n=1 Tax=unclassified Janthinobacterium TaxID=2610881 RepID=UPI00087497F3|nr:MULTISPECIES: MFS transporter [unclassified Janthinobacterium]OEZ67236.1 putative symporter YagG [Janthinobacterium sp. HH100]OEZ71634.1 putative symporter YagG [Janthinobacterium sp. HH103]QOU71760.1 MFS/sugar transport protein [Janthinobacterium sp. HH102]